MNRQKNKVSFIEYIYWRIYAYLGQRLVEAYFSDLQSAQYCLSNNGILIAGEEESCRRINEALELLRRKDCYGYMLVKRYLRKIAIVRHQRLIMNFCGGTILVRYAKYIPPARIASHLVRLAVQTRIFIYANCLGVLAFKSSGKKISYHIELRSMNLLGVEQVFFDEQAKFVAKASCGGAKPP